MRTAGPRVGHSQEGLPTAAAGPQNTACRTASLADPHTLLLPCHLQNTITLSLMYDTGWREERGRGVHDIGMLGPYNLPTQSPA
ncbi:hypothetical protein E2C01_004239 [Portunus trituberculatus]|uniref:Uncharacterized protein n=1 Tax=Portunus trituberculatus TaxID=210409 RepID=A0A5B7CPE8_PORTR|nr:hypothetical protein [Portunus trituberculatus]